MNYYLQKYTTNQFTYYIYYYFKTNLNIQKTIKIQQVHQKIHTEQFIILFKLFSHICLMRDSRNTTDLVTYQHDSRENMKEFVMTSPHIMLCPIVS